MLPLTRSDTASVKRDLFKKKRISVAAKQGIDRADQLRVGAPVGSQEMPLFHLPDGLEIGEDIGAAEAVDGLLGIADEKKGRVGMAEYFFKNRILHRVRVLKFIDKGRGKSGAHGSGKAAALGPDKAAVDAQQQVVEILNILRLLAKLKFLAHLLESRSLYGKHLPAVEVLKILRVSIKIAEGIEEGMHGRPVFFCSLLQIVIGEAGGFCKKRQLRPVGGKPGVKLAAQPAT